METILIVLGVYLGINLVLAFIVAMDHGCSMYQVVVEDKEISDLMLIDYLMILFSLPATIVYFVLKFVFSILIKIFSWKPVSKQKIR